MQTLVKSFAFILACVSSAFAGSHGTNFANQGSAIGTSLANVSPFSSEQPFLNIVSGGGGWYAGATASSFTASISGTVMTASSVTGTIEVGATVIGAGLGQYNQNTTIVNQLTGTTGKAGTYTVSVSQTFFSTTASTDETSLLYSFLVDSNHYPITFSTSAASNTISTAGVPLLQGLPSPSFYPSGNYVLLWDGTGSFSTTGDISGPVTPCLFGGGGRASNAAILAISVPFSGIGLNLTATGQMPATATFSGTTVTVVGSSYTAGTPISFTNSGGSLPPTISRLPAVYYVLSGGSGGSFSIAASPNGQAINVSGASGTTTSYADYMRNLRLVYSPDSTCGNIGARETLLNSGEIFEPSFISKIKFANVARMIDWGRNVSSPIINWSDRPNPSWVFLDEGLENTGSNALIATGVPLETQVALCNKINADCWINIPALSSDDYVFQAAQLVHSLLNPRLKVYLEYFDEVWNDCLGGCTPVWNNLFILGQQYFPNAGSNFGYAGTYGIYASVRNSAIWKLVWGNDASRVIRMIPGWNVAFGPDGTNAFFAGATANINTGGTSGEFTGGVSNGSGGAGNILAVTGISSGTLVPGSSIVWPHGHAATIGTTITGQTSGSPGGTGNYTVSRALNLAPGTTFDLYGPTVMTGSISGNVLTVSNVSHGLVTIMGQVYGSGVTTPVTIIGTGNAGIAGGTGTGGTGTYVIDNPQSVSSETLYLTYWTDQSASNADYQYVAPYFVTGTPRAWSALGSVGFDKFFNVMTANNPIVIPYGTGINTTSHISGTCSIGSGTINKYSGTSGQSLPDPPPNGTVIQLEFDAASLGCDTLSVDGGAFYPIQSDNEALACGYISGTTLTTTSSVFSGSFVDGGTVTGSSTWNANCPTSGTVSANTIITAGGDPNNNSGGSFTVNNSQTVGSSGTPVTLSVGTTVQAGTIGASSKWNLTFTNATGVGSMVPSWRLLQTVDSGISTGSINEVVGWTQNNVTDAAGYGLGIVLYEMGWGYTSNSNDEAAQFLVTATQDPRMTPAMMQFFNGLRNVSGMEGTMTYYNDIGQYTFHGFAWGNWQSTFQTPNPPRAVGTLNWIAQNPCWFTIVGANCRHN